MTKLLLLSVFWLAGVAVLHAARPAPGIAPMARLQEEEDRRFADLYRKVS